MAKKYKRIYGYALVMTVAALVIVAVACISENRVENFQGQYEENLTVSQKQILDLEKKIVDLENENSEIKKKLDERMDLASDLTTGQQALSDLKDIYEEYKAGKVDEARKKFGKIEPNGFDDATLSYYEILSDILKR